MSAITIIVNSLRLAQAGSRVGRLQNSAICWNISLNLRTQTVIRKDKLRGLKNAEQRQSAGKAPKSALRTRRILRDFTPNSRLVSSEMIKSNPHGDMRCKYFKNNVTIVCGMPKVAKFLVW